MIPEWIKAAVSRVLTTPSAASRVSAAVPAVRQPTNFYSAIDPALAKDRRPINYVLPGSQSVWYGDTNVEARNRRHLSALGRALYDNIGMVGYAVGQFTRHCCPLRPQSAASDRDAQRRYEEFFEDWVPRAETTGRFDFYDLQRLLVIGATTESDVAILANGENGGVSLQVLPGWRIGSPDGAPPGVIDGVSIDEVGRIQGYWVGDGSTFSTPIPANQMFLYYIPDNISSYRGNSPLRRGMNDARDGEDIKHFGQLKQKIFSSMPAFIKGGPLKKDPWTSGSSVVTSGGEFKSIGLLDLLGGDIPALPDGQEIVPLVRGDGGGGDIGEWVALLSAHMIMGLSLPPAFFLDEKLTGPNARSVNGKANAAFKEAMKPMRRFTSWVWARVIASGIASGALPAVPGWWRCEHIQPPELSIDGGNDSQSDRDDVILGLKTRKGIHSRRSEVWDREIDQSFAEDDLIIEKCKELATKHNVPVEMLLARRFGANYQPSRPESAAPKKGDAAPPKKESPNA